MKQFSERLMSALQAHAAGRLDQAEVAFETLLAATAALEQGDKETLSLLLEFLRDEREALINGGPVGTVNAILQAGGLALRLDHTDLAIAFFRRALVAKPGSPAATAALANGLREAGLFDPALALYQSLAEAQPKKARWRHEIGITLRKMNRMAEAIMALEKAREMAPDDAATAWALATTLIQSGPQFGREGEGWALSTARWRLASHSSTALDAGLPAWSPTLQASDPDSVGGVLVWTEQGIGDEIMFAGLLGRLADLVGNLLLWTSDKNRALFQRSFPSIPLYEAGRPLPPGITHQIAFGDLPGFLCASEGRIGPLAPWLQAPQNRAEALRQAYRGEGAGKSPLLVGLCWRPTSLTREGMKRTPPLAHWKSLLSQPGLRFVNLQPRAEAKEIRDLRNTGAEIIHDRTIDPWDDLDGYAAQIKALDLVISVDCSTVHLAGALGVPCWILLPWPADYRWPRLATETGWYPSLRLFPVQPDSGWEAAFEATAIELKAFAGDL